jgi:hypothetical protein
VGDVLGELRRIAVRVVPVALALAVFVPSSAGAIPGTGPHETVDITITTKRPNASTGLNWYAQYRNPANPQADPPALRRLVIVGPSGTHSDTSVTAECRATDDQFRQSGESACPAESHIGWGKATARLLSAVPMTFDTSLFNAPDEQVELVKVAGGGGAVVRGTIRDNVLDSPIPTCLMGGQPPAGCPSDQVVLLSNELHQRPLSIGRGRHRRNLLTTPPKCPRSRLWTTQVTFYYADGAVDRVATKQPCRPG